MEKDSIRFIHAADLHLGHIQYSNKERYRDFNRVFKWLLDTTIQENADFLILSGDFFNQSTVKPETMLVVFKFIQEFKELTHDEVPIIVIEGNHDLKKYGMMRSWLQFLAETGLVFLLDAIQMENGDIIFNEYDEKIRSGGYYHIKGINIYGVRWHGSATQEYFDAIKNAIKTDGFNLLMMHFGIKGQLHRVDGIDYDQSLEKLSEKVNYLALGHYHKRYEIKNWIFNPGSLESNDFTEFEFERGVYCVDVSNVEKGEFTSKFISVKKNNRNFFNRYIDIGSSSLPDFVSALHFVLDSLSNELTPKTSEDNKLSDLKVPVVNLILKGSINYKRQEMDIPLLKQQINEQFLVLETRIRNECVSQEDGYYVEDEEGFNRDEVELKIYNSIIENDLVFKGISDKIAHIMKETQNSILLGAGSINSVALSLEDWWDREGIESYMNDEKHNLESSNSLPSSIENNDVILKSKENTRETLANASKNRRKSSSNQSRLF